MVCPWFYTRFTPKQDPSLDLSLVRSFTSAGLSRVSSNLQRAAAMGEDRSALLLEALLLFHSDLFWQVSKIGELTSVIPSMLTTACWILRPTNAGRSLLRTPSGTTGKTSTAFTTGLWPNSYQLPVETSKLICFACHHTHRDEAEILKYPPDPIATTRKRLDHLRILP